MDLISFIIPVYDRPEEVGELLNSFTAQKEKLEFEILVVDDGSKAKCDRICQAYSHILPVWYFYKENSGPAATRNYAMERAAGDFFVFLDSDTLLPENYFEVLNRILCSDKPVDALSGPDTAAPSFSPIQKAINYAMTSFWTTGGLRGGKKNLTGMRQLRSYNMGLSRRAFLQTKGFSLQRFGEDIDLTFRLKEKGFEVVWNPELFVYHKRRTSLKQFFTQVKNFGAARPILSDKYPDTAKITYWFPLLFLFFTAASLIGSLIRWWIILPLALYLLVIFVDSSLRYKNIRTGFLSLCAACVQFAGYGSGFLRSRFRLMFTYNYKKVFPEMFYRV